MSVEATVELAIDDNRWTTHDLPEIAERACTIALAEAGLSGQFEISLLATSDAEITRLNEQFRAKDRPTNVLSWPNELRAPVAPGAVPPPPTDPEIGDIALAYETCTSEALELGRPIEDHLTHLILHGCLHLLGYDHVRDEDATMMEGLEITALEKLGIGNPYL